MKLMNEPILQLTVIYDLYTASMNKDQNVLFWKKDQLNCI